MKLLHPAADTAARLRDLVGLPVVGRLLDLGLRLQLIEALLQGLDRGLQLADFIGARPGAAASAGGQRSRRPPCRIART